MASEYLPLIQDSSSAPEIPTFKDLVDLMALYQSALGNDNRRLELAKRAVFSAYRSAISQHPWRFYNRTTTFTTSPDVSITGAAYTASTRTFTVTGAPSWGRDGSVQISSGTYEGEYEIEDVASDGTSITLRLDSAIADDIASVDIRVVRRRYPLPVDFHTDKTVYDNRANRHLKRFVPSEEHIEGPWNRRTPDDPIGYHVRSGRSAIGKWIELTPPPTDTRVISISYQSHGRPLLTYEVAGTVTGTAGSTTVTFGEAPGSNCVGSVLRIRTADSSIPTSLAGAAPWEVQRVLTALSGTSGTLDVALDASVSSAACVISDPIDADPNVLMPYMEMYALYKLGQMTRSDDAAKIKHTDLTREYMLACERDAGCSYADLSLAGWYEWAEVDYMEFAS